MVTPTLDELFALVNDDQEQQAVENEAQETAYCYEHGKLVDKASNEH